VLLFDSGPEVLATFGDKLSSKATRELEKIGVEIHLNSLVTHIDADGIDVKGPEGLVQHFSTKTKIWAAGVLTSPLAKKLADATGAQCDRAGRIKVEPDCSLPGLARRAHHCRDWVQEPTHSSHPLVPVLHRHEPLGTSNRR
jgi:NADH:ubiquinone reductase (H+-translocating)